MKDEKLTLKLLKPDKYGKNDPDNPRKMDVEKIINEVKKKKYTEKKSKKIVVNGDINSK